MSTTDSTECDRLNVAVSKMVALPGLSVKDAMLIARFTDDEVEDKNMQRKVLRRLPGKGKRNMREIASKSAEEVSIIQSIDVENEKNSDVSPITHDGATSLLKSGGSQKQKSRGGQISWRNNFLRRLRQILQSATLHWEGMSRERWKISSWQLQNLQMINGRL